MQIPIFDIQYNSPEDLLNSTQGKKTCQDVTQAIIDYSCLCVKLPFVDEEDNASFIQMMDKYFQQPLDVLLKDARPETGYQAGFTPGFKEKPRSVSDERLQTEIREKRINHEAVQPQHLDQKMRFMWKIGVTPQITQFREFTIDPIVPQNFPEWADTMNSWGHKMVHAIEYLSKIIAVGLDLDINLIYDKLQGGPHLLGPTGSKLRGDMLEGEILAGYHYDLSFLTVHGKSNYPGLRIWTKKDERVDVQVPKGYLLMQAGLQLEHISGGLIRAGRHEVVVTQQLKQIINQRLEEGKVLIRVSSTLFSQLAADSLVEPYIKNKSQSTTDMYPKMLAQDIVNNELQFLQLRDPSLCRNGVTSIG